MVKNVFLAFLMLLFFSSMVYSKSLTLVTLESPPAEYIEDGRPVGINVEIVTEGLKRMGYEANIQFVPWKRALNMVKKGTADGIIDAAYSKERNAYLHYPTEEIYVEEWYCFKRKDSELTLDEDFANAGNITLGISRGFVYGGLIQNAIDNQYFKRVEEVRNNELNIKKIVTGRLDMFVGVKATILFLIREMGYSDTIEITKTTGTNKNFLLSSSKTYLAFSKAVLEKEIAEQFSRITSEMKKDGTIKRITMKYQ